MPIQRKTLSAMGGILIHIEVIPHGGEWGVATLTRLHQDGASRDKQASILHRSRHPASTIEEAEIFVSGKKLHAQKRTGGGEERRKKKQRGGKIEKHHQQNQK